METTNGRRVSRPSHLSFPSYRETNYRFAVAVIMYTNHTCTSLETRWHLNTIEESVFRLILIISIRES